MSSNVEVRWAPTLSHSLLYTAVTTLTHPLTLKPTHTS